MKVAELIEKTKEELEHTLLDKQEELSNLHFQLAMHQLDNTTLLKNAKHDISRIKTILREYELDIRKPIGE